MPWKATLPPSPRAHVEECGVPTTAYLDSQSIQNNGLYTQNKGCLGCEFGYLGGPGTGILSSGNEVLIANGATWSLGPAGPQNTAALAVS